MVEPLILAIIDDDDDVRKALGRLLRSLGHDVKAFRSAEEFEAAAPVVDCVVVDLRLPGLSGLELRERLRSRATPLPVVLITGDGDRLDRDVSRASDTPSITKPFDDAALMAAIADAISSAHPRRERHAS